MPTRRRSTLVILDDHEGDVYRNKLRIDHRYRDHRLRTAAFSSDEAAAEFVRAEAVDIFGYIQDFVRFGAAPSFVAGMNFYHDVISKHTPWARTAVISGGGFDRAVSWAIGLGLKEIQVASKDLHEDEFYRLVDWLLEVRSSNDASEPAESPLENLQVLDIPWAEVCQYLAQHPHMLHQIDPRVFEKLVAEIFRSHGWHVELTARTRDHGFDVIAVRSDQPHCSRVLVEAKRFNPDRPVGVHVVRALYAVKTLNAVSQVVLATSSRVSTPAKVEFARVIPWELDFMERDAILRWCRKYNAVRLS
jgi:hypothetical protein